MARPDPAWNAWFSMFSSLHARLTMTGEAIDVMAANAIAVVATAGLIVVASVGVIATIAVAVAIGAVAVGMIAVAIHAVRQAVGTGTTTEAGTADEAAAEAPRPTETSMMKFPSRNSGSSVKSE